MPTLREYITSGYGAEIYRKTTLLKEAKKSRAKSKNQLIFLEKCIAHQLLPKSFNVHSPAAGNRQTERIVKKFRKDLLISAKNDAKGRFFRNVRLVQNIQTELATTLTEEDMATITEVTDKAKELMFKKSKERLVKKFEELRKRTKPPKEPPKVSGTSHEFKYVKNPVLNLMNNEVPKHHQDLLSLGPKFVPSARHIPYMDIISTAESSSLKLEYSNKMREAQILRKDVLRVLRTAKPIKDNMTKEQRQA